MDCPAKTRKQVYFLEGDGEEDEGRGVEKRSMITLTEAFIGLLDTRPGASWDLSEVCQTLNAQKRRLYDVTNVAAAVGRIERDRYDKTKVSIGDVPLSRETEQEVDQAIEWVSAERDRVFEDPQVKPYLVMNTEGVLRTAQEPYVYSVRGPPDTRMELFSVADYPERLRFTLKSSTGLVRITRLAPP
jgi:hypothetical protein